MCRWTWPFGKNGRVTLCCSYTRVVVNRFGVAKTQRVALPVIKLKKGSKAVDEGVAADLERMAKEVEEAAATIEQSSKPPGLTKFW